MKKRIISKFDDYDAFQLKKGTLILYTYEGVGEDKYEEYGFADYGIVLDDGVPIAPARTESVNGVYHTTPYVRHSVFWVSDNEVANVFKFHCCDRIKIVIHEG